MGNDMEDETILDLDAHIGPTLGAPCTRRELLDATTSEWDVDPSAGREASYGDPGAFEEAVARTDKRSIQIAVQVEPSSTSGLRSLTARVKNEAPHAPGDFFSHPCLVMCPDERLPTPQGT